MTFEEYEVEVNKYLREHTGYEGDGRGGRGELPQGDYSTSVWELKKVHLRHLFLAGIPPIKAATELAQQAAADAQEALNAAEVAAEAAQSAATDAHGATFYAADLPALRANEESSYPAGTIFATRAEGFSYEVLTSDATDHDLTTEGGVKLRYIPGKSGADPRGIGSPANGTDDDAPFVERLFAQHHHVNLASGETYVFASVIGIPAQSLYSDKAYRLTGFGANVILDGVAAGDDIITNFETKVNPLEQTMGKFVGKLDVFGINFTQRSSSVLLNGDRIYNINGMFNHCRAITSVIRSYRNKGSGYPNGYMQSVSLAFNHLVSVSKVIDAKRAYNVKWIDNKCEGCTAGIYIDGPDDAAVVSFVMRDGLFEGGGLSVKLGKTLNARIEGVYFEANTGGDVPTEKCDILITGVRSQGVSIANCVFQPTTSQKSDEEYYSIKDNAPPLEQAAVSVRDCTTTGVRLFQPGRVFDAGGNAGPSSLHLNSRAPQPHGFARVSYLSGRQQRTNSAHLSGGVYQVAQISVSEVINRIANNRQRNACGTIWLMMEHRTAGGIHIGTTAVVVDFVASGTAAGVSSGQVNDAYMWFTLRSSVNIPAGLPIETTYSNTTKIHFSATALSAVRSGNSYILSLSGYAAPTTTNYGPATQMTTNITMQINAMNGSDGETTSLIAIG